MQAPKVVVYTHITVVSYPQKIPLDTDSQRLADRVPFWPRNHTFVPIKSLCILLPSSQVYQFQQGSLRTGWKASLTHRTDSLCDRITGLAQNPTILVIRVDAIPPLPGYLFHDAYVLKVPDGAVHCR